ncbi:uncharacterized protein UTRI_10435 [Ustilago trichophora]|uniref:DUF4252 domain-containing protein n=1 Tax=Ustilago trichophora TaxID=86804 RepID=A0A5C3EA52_9BASI|nr:uncharacterized protein UTRI_10435 [Ustilago trichophora]
MLYRPHSIAQLLLLLFITATTLIEAQPPLTASDLKHLEIARYTYAGIHGYDIDLREDGLEKFDKVEDLKEKLLAIAKDKGVNSFDAKKSILEHFGIRKSKPYFTVIVRPDDELHGQMGLEHDRAALAFFHVRKHGADLLRIDTVLEGVLTMQPSIFNPVVKLL